MTHLIISYFSNIHNEKYKKIYNKKKKLKFIYKQSKKMSH